MITVVDGISGPIEIVLSEMIASDGPTDNVTPPTVTGIGIPPPEAATSLGGTTRRFIDP